MAISLDIVFSALADPTRREIVALLSEKEMNVNQIAAHFDMTRPGVAKHLTILKEGGVISTQKKGRQTVNKLEADTLKAVDRFVIFIFKAVIQCPLSNFGCYVAV